MRKDSASAGPFSIPSYLIKPKGLLFPIIILISLYLFGRDEFYNEGSKVV